VTMKRPKTLGLHPYRFGPNPEEQRFAEAWATHDSQGQTLAWLLHLGDQPGCGPADPTEREQAVAATVVQWLGSPVGQNFLASLGYEKRA
jgi:hypothetical protein